MISTYQQAREYLESFIHAKNYEKVTVGSNDQTDHLGRMRHLLRLLGNPQNTFPSVIISGTSGKGSTTYLLARMLTMAGYKTGFTSSPHLQKITERMQIGDGSHELAAITDEAFIDLLTSTIPIVEAMGNSQFGLPTYYEILIALTLRYFSQQNIDIAVIEVGLEGKFDATNLLYPLIFVLTNISLDHTAILGDTVDKIAEEATYRIKDLQLSHTTQKPVVITGVSQPSIMQLTDRRAAEADATVLKLYKDFEVTNVLPHESGVIFDFRTSNRIFRQLDVALRGEYQATNAGLAIATVLQLHAFGFSVSEHGIRSALSTAFFPGRFEVRVSDGMTYIIDGAHNLAKIQAFCSSLHTLYRDKKKVFLVAFKKDKEIGILLRLIDEEADAIIITRFVSSVDLGKNLGMEMQEAQTHVGQAELKTKLVLFENDSKRALAMAEARAHTISGWVVATGSMYFVGEVSDMLDARLNDPAR